MNPIDIKNLLFIEAIEKKIFKTKSMYHPNLIANLSEEAYDLYVIRNSICDQLLELINERNIKISRVNEFIKEKIKKNKQKLKAAKNVKEVDTIKRTIEEWKQFL
jgi:hypothetical protein